MAEVHNNPNLRSPKTSQKIMLDVCIALCPALVGAVVFFGMNALILTLVSVVTCVLTEAIYETICKKQLTISDMTAVVTGMLIAFNMSSTTPVWVVILADIFAILVVKQLFGGVGSNVVNPALMGRLFVMTVYPAKMMSYALPAGVDAASSATVLSGGSFSAVQMIIGQIPGALGETSALLLFVGFLYLVYKKEVNWMASLVYILIVGVVSGLILGNIAAGFFAGGVFLGGLFMLTDYVFVNKKGHLLYAVVAAVVTVAIRCFSSYPEGVCFGILLTNCAVYFIDKFAKKPHVYGIKD
jgi:electron transport complex protein RnfD